MIESGPRTQKRKIKTKKIFKKKEEEEEEIELTSLIYMPIFSEQFQLHIHTNGQIYYGQVCLKTKTQAFTKLLLLVYGSGNHRVLQLVRS